MTSWEYKVIRFRLQDLDWPVSREEVTPTALNALGKDGWETYAVTIAGTYSYCYLKRPLVGDYNCQADPTDMTR